MIKFGSPVMIKSGFFEGCQGIAINYYQDVMGKGEYKIEIKDWLKVDTAERIIVSEDIVEEYND